MPPARSTTANSRMAALIALVLLLKALVPTGWMPTFEGGALTLRVCGSWAAGLDRPTPPAGDGHHAAHGAHGTHAGHDEEPRHHGEGQGPDQPCSFAVAGQPAAPFGAPADALPLATASAVPAFPHIVSLGHGLAAPPPPSTGPPHLS